MQLAAFVIWDGNCIMHNAYITCTNLNNARVTRYLQNRLLPAAHNFFLLLLLSWVGFLLCAAEYKRCVTSYFHWLCLPVLINIWVGIRRPVCDNNMVEITAMPFFKFSLLSWEDFKICCVFGWKKKKRTKKFERALISGSYVHFYI